MKNKKINQMTTAEVKAALKKTAASGDTQSRHVLALRQRLQQLATP